MDNKQTKKPNLNVPILFQKLDTYNTEDSRFVTVKIYLMHTGANHNGSYFSKEVIEDAIPTLANTPILAYIEDNSDGEKDFSDHRMILIQDNGKFKMKYIGQAIGVIPENNNAKFEMRLCDDGIEREFLTVEGLLWTKFDDPIDIMLRDGIKAQSMELHEEYEGEFKDDGLFHFTKFKFFGACGLGKDVLPAMQNASIEVYSNDAITSVINEKMEEFKSILNNYTSNKGGNDVEEKLKLLKQYNFTKEDFSDLNLEEISIEDLEVKVKEKFALTAEQFRDEIIAELRKEKVTDEWGYEYSRYSYVDYKDNLIFAYDREDWKLYGFNFTIDGDNVFIDFDSKKRYKFDIVPFEDGSATEFELYPKDAIEYAKQVKEKEVKKDTENKITEYTLKIDELKTSYEELEKELVKLREFKKTTLEKQRKEQEEVLFKQYEELKDVEGYEKLKETASEFTIEELEKELALLYVKHKANFSLNSNKANTVKINIHKDNEEDKPESPYGDLFDKYVK